MWSELTELTNLQFYSFQILIQQFAVFSKLALNCLDRSGRPWTCDLPASIFQVVRITGMATWSNSTKVICQLIENWDPRPSVPARPRVYLPNTITTLWWHSTEKMLHPRLWHSFILCGLQVSSILSRATNINEANKTILLTLIISVFNENIFLLAMQ